jgi:hypothetical protein
VRLWKRMGFDIIGTVPGAFHHPRLGYVDAYVMFKLLAAVNQVSSPTRPNVGG